MLAAVDHVQLAAPPGSEDALRAYYTDVLGMTELPYTAVDQDQSLRNASRVMSMRMSYGTLVLSWSW